ncbi:conserved unknown protein [Chrysochromulina tobinii]|uniref:NYN domain-containing protein n=1 Tax=Chrysochromulina tobinii TaxID=1460289 RepID=A0A0M0J6Q8_9EUKA|nr:conserved unknown protein [Chrysochromulina tobinii]|eukprot:KOO22140.1 conserved unknown protein [Chrysochromulina sp. CCMP291]
MIFIDGSWLYYSLHGRRPNCPVTRKYGEGWEYSHSIDFDRLPQLIAQRLHKEMLERFKTQRFVEVVRSVAFASMRADTDVQSPRKRLFKGMEKANYDVHLSTTVGHQEKCIDIALAVEMMHYASLPGAYDVAVLVSGDKDFMPALSRIRTKGKRVAICSMRNCCSHDLLGPQAHVRDFEPIWLDDHLDYLIRPKADALAPGAPQSTASELLRLVKEFIRERTLAGQSPASRIGNEDTLSQLKQRHFGLRAFFATFPDIFHCEFTEDGDGAISATDGEGGPQPKAAGGGESSLKQADEAETLLQESVRAFLLEQGGVASSRNVGRHLASRGQLAKLKQQFSGLFHFLQRNDQLFRIVLPSDDKGPQMLEYQSTAERSEFA